MRAAGLWDLKLPNVKRQYRWAVRRRLRAVAYVEAHSLLGASQHFGLDRKTIREWRDRYRAEGVAGLVPRYPAQRPSRLAPETIVLQTRFGEMSVAPETVLRLPRGLMGFAGLNE